MIVKKFALVLLFGVAQAQGLTVRTPGQAGQKRTNWIAQSNTASTNTAATSPWGLYSSTATPTVTTIAGAAIGGTWAELTNTAQGVLYQSYATTASASHLISAYIVTASGSQDAYVGVSCEGTTVSVCSCSTSDARACAASAGFGTELNHCGGWTTASTTPVRLSVMATCAGTVIAPLAIAGAYRPTGMRSGANFGTARFSGFQGEIGVSKPSKLCVTTTAIKTCK